MNRFREKWAGMSPAARGIRIVGMVLAGVVGAAVFALVFGWAVMLLWNWLMPVVFHLGVIGYWQAFGIVILAKLIFGGIGGGRGGGHRNPWKGNPWEGRHGRDDWRFYREFWEKEGHQAFDRFVQEKKAAENPQEETHGA
jgi:hypothetical protein